MLIMSTIVRRAFKGRSRGWMAAGVGSLVLCIAGCRRAPAPLPSAASLTSSSASSPDGPLGVEAAAAESATLRAATSPSAVSTTPAKTRRTTPPDAPRLLDVPFEELQPLLLLRKLAPGEKAALWQRSYRHRWVRWSGRLASLTPDGATFRILPGTATYDVSLNVEPAARERLRHHYRVGDRVVFIGRLERYDPVFFNFQLSHGDVPEPGAVTKPH